MTGETPRYLIGVDAGGSKTLALLAVARSESPGFSILGRGLGGPGNYQSAGTDAAFAALETAIHAAWNAAGIPPAPAAAVCLGMAGVGRPEDRALVETWAARHFAGAPVMIAHDAQLVLAAGTPAGAGVAVISGTGSMVYAEDGQGRSARAGGWGYLLGDEGSGYAIGLAGLRAVARAHDGRAPATLLTRLVLDHLGLAEPSGLVEKVYRSGMTRAEIGRTAVLVESAAAQNDPPALEVLAQAADELVLAAAAAARALSLLEPIPCALGGGMFTKGTALRAAFARAAHRTGLRLDPLTLVEEPALGAVILAKMVS